MKLYTYVTETSPKKIKIEKWIGLNILNHINHISKETKERGKDVTKRETRPALTGLCGLHNIPGRLA